MAKAKLHELLAVEPDLRKAADAMAIDAKVTFDKKADHFQGSTTNTNFFDAKRTGENTQSNKALVSTVEERLDYANKFIGKFWDAMLQKDVTNTRAVADLIVEGTTYAKGIPAVFFLSMEEKLKAYRDILLAIPTLNPSIVWTEEPTADKPGVYRSTPAQQNLTEKVIKTHVLYDATDKHPAQVKEYSEDVPVAQRVTVTTSGMWTPLRKAQTLERLDTLLVSMKKARQRANDVEASEDKIAKTLFDYIMG